MGNRTVSLLFAPLIARALDAQELTGCEPRPLGSLIGYPELTAVADVVVALGRRTPDDERPCAVLARWG